MDTVSFDVDEFIAVQDDMMVFEKYRRNNSHVYEYIKIIIQQAYIQGSIDTYINVIKDTKE